MCEYQVALITGATGGIGGATAKELVRNGLKVVITGRNEKKLNELLGQLGSENVLHAQAFDINDFEQVKGFVKNIKDKGIVVDVLVNNAGLALELMPFQDYEVEDMITMIDTNVKSLMLLSSLMVKDMVKNNKGFIVNIGSIAGQFAYPNGSIYCASKAAVQVLSAGMRADLIETDIRVTNIMPGLVETNFSLVRFKGDQEKAANVYKGIEAVQPEDIANAVWFVISQPKRVQIGEMTILANQQASGVQTFRK